MKLQTSVLALCLMAIATSGCASSQTDSEQRNGSPSGTEEQHSKGTAPISEKLTSVQQCMADEGIEAEYDGRGGLFSEGTTDEQSSLWEEVYSLCAEEVGLDSPKSEPQLRALYELEVKNHECLVREGYDSATPPSEQAYVDSWMQNKEYYQSIATLAEEQPDLFIEATQKCPLPLWSFE